MSGNTMGLRRRSILSSLASAAMAGLPLASEAASKTLNWYTFGSYNRTELRARFESESGVGINPILITDNADVYLKLRQGGPRQADVVMADGAWPIKDYNDKLTEALDLAEFKSASTLMPEFRNYKPWKTSDGKLMQFPLFWSPAGIAYVKGKVPRPDSWSILFDPKYRGRVLWYTQDYMFGVTALLSGHKDPFGLTPGEIEETKKKLIAAKSVARGIPTTFNDVVRALVAGEADVALMGSRGLALRVMESGGPEIGFAIPKEGTMGWVDGSMLVNGSSNRTEARRWIDFFHRPENVFELAKLAKHAVTDRRVLEMLEASPEGRRLVEFHDMRNLAPLEQMHLRKPPTNLQVQLEAWNEVIAS